MSQLPTVGGLELVRALERVGFRVEGDSGRKSGGEEVQLGARLAWLTSSPISRSLARHTRHVVLRHADRRCTIVPVHKGEVLGPGLLLKIADDIELSREQLVELLKD